MEEFSFLGDLLDKVTLGRCGLALDIGANVGEWSRWLSPRFDFVVAVEPDTRAYADLCVRLPKNVFAANKAVSYSTGEVEFFMRASSLQSSMLAEHPIGGAKCADAPVLSTVWLDGITLDDVARIAGEKFLTSEVDFVKLDVEGCEGIALAGATLPCFSSCRWLIEIHDRAEVVGHELKRLGYEAIRIMKHPHPEAHPEHFWIYAEPHI